MNLARVRKAITATVGLAVTLVLLVPQDSIPERWRPWVGAVLAVGTVAGVYKVRNDRPAPTQEELAERAERIRAEEHGPPARFRKQKDRPFETP